MKPETLYDEACKMYRFYLTWRQAMFVGYVVAVFNVLSKCIEEGMTESSGLILLAGGALGAAVYEGDKRIRELYHWAQLTAAAIQRDNEPGRKLGEPTNLHSNLMLPPGTLIPLPEGIDRPKNVPGPHSKALRYTYCGSCMLQLLVGVYLLAVPFLPRLIARLL